MSMTMDKLAQLTGTSMATVSRVLGNKPGVASKTREKVLRVAQELGYQPNQNARSLALRKTQLIGLVAAELRNPGHLEFLRQTEALCRLHGYQVLVMDSARDIEQEKQNIDIMLQHRVDGLLIFPVSDWVFGHSHDHLLRLKLKHFPFVVIGKIDGYPFDITCSEEIESSRRLAAHLIELGHRRFGFIGEQMDNRCIRDRMQGICLALNGAGISADPQGTPPTFRFVRVGNGAQENVVQWMRENNPPTALIAADSALALAFYLPLSRAGIRIPQDVSLVGYDDEHWTSRVSPPMTVSAANTAEIGRVAFESLMLRIQERERPVMTNFIPQELTIRESSGPAAAELSA